MNADARYIDFANTKGFDETGFDPSTFAVRGFGWKSMAVVAVGVEHALRPGLPIRAGYSYNDNPIDSAASFFNAPAPAIVQRHLSGGFSVDFTEKLTLSMAAQDGLENNVSGNWKTVGPDGSTVSIPGTTASCTLSTFTAAAGVHMKF
ncbi:MAG: long-chain fatty acid transport protein [Rhodothermales bacterium]